jgi:hypothetical protein
MIKVENIEVYGWEAAIRGMRNPMNSWEKSDSHFTEVFEDTENLRDYYISGAELGANDLDLMNRLYKAGTEHRKYLRMITATMDITAPLYWWKEFDTYKVGTVANSCSTMHKIHAKEFTFDDFSTDHLEDFSWNRLDDLIGHLNICRNRYIETKEKQWWWQMIQLLPSSYNQRRTVQMSYENVMAMIKQRENHKLDEWVEFVGILKDLPYVREITGKENEDAML